MTKKVKFIVNDENQGIVQIENARLSFPNLWRPGMYLGAEKSNLDSSLLIPLEEKAVAKQIHDFIVARARTIDPSIKKVSELVDPKFIKHESDGWWIVKTTNTLRYPPKYVNEAGKIEANPLECGAENKLYAGCHVRVKLNINPTQVNKNKVKVWVNIVAIQFMSDGEPFGSFLNDEDVMDGFTPVEPAAGSEFAEADGGDIDDDDEFDLDDFE